MLEEEERRKERQEADADAAARAQQEQLRAERARQEQRLRQEGWPNAQPNPAVPIDTPPPPQPPLAAKSVGGRPSTAQANARTAQHDPLQQKITQWFTPKPREAPQPPPQAIDATQQQQDRRRERDE